MKVTYRTHDTRISVEVEGKDNKDIFRQLSVFQEIFEHRVCGACEGERIRFSVREVQGNTYYELKCMDCGATLAFGQKKADGSLFPKRKDKDGNWLPNNGWVKWAPKDDESPF